MKSRHVHALFDSADAATAAYAAVQARGCATEHCSAVVHEKHVDEDDLTTDERAGRPVAF